MKKIILLVMWAMLLVGSQEAFAQKGQVVADEKGVVVVVDSDTVARIKADLGEVLEDSGYNYNYAEDEDGNEVQDPNVPLVDHGVVDGTAMLDRMFGIGSGIIVGILCIVFGFPTLIVLLILYFRYRNKQAKYKLAAKALENGQPIPDGLLGNYSGFRGFEHREQRRPSRPEGNSQRVDEASPRSEGASPRSEGASPRSEDVSQRHEETTNAASSETRQQPSDSIYPSSGSAFGKIVNVLSFLYNTNKNVHNGLRQLFVGLGLWAFFSYAEWGSFFEGISILVIFIASGMILAGYLEGYPRYKKDNEPKE
jgi:hypothetical protein